MKQEKITIAYKMLEKINRVPGLPFSVCSKLFMAKKSLAPYIEAQAEKENVLFENAGVDDNGKMMITKELKDAFAEILKTEVDFTMEPVVIKLTQENADKIGMTGEIMEKLEGIVQFVEVEA